MADTLKENRLTPTHCGECGRRVGSWWSKLDKSRAAGVLDFSACITLGVAILAVEGLWLSPSEYEQLFLTAWSAATVLTLVCWTSEFIVRRT